MLQFLVYTLGSYNYCLLVNKCYSLIVQHPASSSTSRSFSAFSAVSSRSISGTIRFLIEPFTYSISLFCSYDPVFCLINCANCVLHINELILNAVMWIRIDYIRIQVNRITKFISNQLLTVKNTLIF